MEGGRLDPRVKLPSERTLAKYGLTLDEWIEMANGGVCRICERVPPNGRMVVDHRHVPGWKKMSPQQRRRYVRSVVCSGCNHYAISIFLTPKKARNVADYLEQFDDRFNGREGKGHDR